MAGRITIISDTHLGRPRQAALSADALRPIWAESSRLIINGDIAELHHPDLEDEAEAQVIRLFELTMLDGVVLTLISGNHDPYISDLRHVHIAEGAVFVTHGDVLHPAIAPWSPAAPRVLDAHERALARIAPEDRDHLQARLSVSRYASTAERHALEKAASHTRFFDLLLHPRAVVKVLHYWYTIPRLAAHFTRNHAPEARFMVFGHTHHPGIWTIEDLTIINTGSFGFPGKPRAVVIENGELKVLAIRLQGGEYRLAKKPIRTYELPESLSAPSAAKTRPDIVRPSTPAM